MNCKIQYSDVTAPKTITADDMEQIIDAIISGKYSWACVLMLQSMGYNPLHYIPYRTYNRLTKEHCQSARSSQHSKLSLTSKNSQACSKVHNQTTSRSHKIGNLEYCHSIHQEDTSKRGGCLTHLPNDYHTQRQLFLIGIVQR